MRDSSPATCVADRTTEGLLRGGEGAGQASRKGKVEMGLGRRAEQPRGWGGVLCAALAAALQGWRSAGRSGALGLGPSEASQSGPGVGSRPGQSATRGRLSLPVLGLRQAPYWGATSRLPTAGAQGSPPSSGVLLRCSAPAPAPYNCVALAK